MGAAKTIFFRNLSQIYYRGIYNGLENDNQIMLALDRWCEIYNENSTLKRSKYLTSTQPVLIVEIYNPGAALTLVLQRRYAYVYLYKYLRYKFYN